MLAIFATNFSEPASEEASLVFSSTMDIRRIYLNGTAWPGNSSIAQLQTLALEFDHRNRTLCYVRNNGSSALLSCADIDDLSHAWDLPAPTMFPLYGQSPTNSSFYFPALYTVVQRDTWNMPK